MRQIQYNIRITFFVFLGLIMGETTFAQQTPLSNFYNFNEYLLNPSEAGLKDNIEGTVSHRTQWQGIEGAPTSTFLGVHGAFNESMGIGGKITVDQTDLLKQFNATLSYAYRIKIKEKVNLSFGVSATMIQNSVGYSDAVVGDLADDVVNGGDESGIAFDAEAGMLLSFNKGKVGVSTAHLFESGVGYQLPDDRGTGTFERIRQFSLYGSYELDLSEVLTIEPLAIIRNQGVESFQWEMNALAAWKKILYLGAGYRQEAGFIGRLGFQVTDQLMAAYAYEFSGNGIASYSSGSHEFMLGLRLNKKSSKEDVKKELVLEPLIKQEKVEEIINEEEEKASQLEQERIELEQEQAQKAVEVATEKKVQARIQRQKVEKIEKVLDRQIPFEFQADGLGTRTQKSLNQIAFELKNNPEISVLIKGHTCNMGSEEVNTKYSLKRANRVKDYLLEKGVSKSQMEVKAMRDTEPLVPNTSIENRKKNRRVEIEIMQ